MVSSLFYFAYFAAIGVFIPYWPVYLHHLNLSSIQIATIYSIPGFARSIFPIIYGYLADRLSARKNVLILASFGQIPPLVMLIWFHSYEWLLALISIHSIFNAPIIPFTDATVQEEQEKGKLDYGRTRMWGTISFILAAAGFGRLLDNFGDEWILYGLIFFLVLVFFLSTAMPAGKTALRFQHEFILRALIDRNTWIFLMCALLLSVSHGTYYGFYSIYLTTLGFSDSGIGLQWAIAATSEVCVLIFATRILKTFSHRFLFSFCLAMAVLRWLLTYSTTSYSLLLAYQCFHAFSFAAFHITALRLIHEIFPEGFRSFGQSLYGSIYMGVGVVVGVLINGYLWDKQGAAAFLISSVVAFAALLLSFFFKPVVSELTQSR